MELLWFDNRPISIENKIKAAKEYYIHKYAPLIPTRARVNLKALSSEQIIEGIRVIPMKGVLRYDIFIGREEDRYQ